MLVVSGLPYATKPSEVIDLANPSNTCEPWADDIVGTWDAAGAFVDPQVILCGGANYDEDYSNACYLFTPTSTEALASLNVGFRGAEATELHGKVFLSGGYGKNLLGITSLKLVFKLRTREKTIKFNSSRLNHF